MSIQRMGGTLSRHEQLERLHDQRQSEREASANGTLAPPPGAGPNWAKNRERALAKYAKATSRRHAKHRKKERKWAEAAQKTEEKDGSVEERRPEEDDDGKDAYAKSRGDGDATNAQGGEERKTQF